MSQALDPARATGGGGGPTHAAWHVALLLAGGSLLLALVIDPESAVDARESGQLRIARIGLGVIAAGLVGIWVIRGGLQRDLETAIARFRSAPGDLDPSRLVAGFVSGPRRTLAWAAAAVWFAASSIALARGSGWVEHATIENGILETITVLAYLAAAVFAARALWPYVRAGFRGGELRRWFLLAAAAGCFLIAAEETDWGQTYLQYATPASIEQANIQGDLSLHNLALPESFGVTRWANWVLRGLAAVLGGLVPLLLFTSAAFRRLVFALDVPLPPWWSQAVLLASVFIPEIEGRFLRNNVGSELREVAFSVAVLVWVACATRRDALAPSTSR